MVARLRYRMSTELSDRVREIAGTRGISESEVFEQALERGLEALWEDLVLTQYVEGEIDRETAVERVGRATVQQADNEVAAVEEDVDWGLNA